MDRRDAERKEESRRILERVNRDSDSLFLRSASRARDHFAAREAEGEDWTELWGRRIGRTLGLVAAFLLVLWIVFSLAGGS